MLGKRVIGNILGKKPFGVIKKDTRSRNMDMFKFGFREEDVGPDLWFKRNRIVGVYLDISPDPWFKADDLVTVANFNIAKDWLDSQGISY